MSWNKSIRTTILLYFCLAGFVILVGRLGYLQVIKFSYFKKISDENRIRVLPQPAARGLMFDRNGKLITGNRTSFTVALIPSEIKSSKRVLSEFAEFLELDSLYLRKKIERVVFSAHFPIPVQRNADFAVISKVAEQSEDLPGVVIRAEQTRNYQPGTGASQVIGYVGEMSEKELDRFPDQSVRPGAYIGKTGLEKTYDGLLRGTDGAKFYEMSAKGRIIGELPEDSRANPVAGSDIMLTIDSDLQVVAESLLAQHERGAVVAIEPSTGEILCIVSQPGFDANYFVSGLSEDKWQSLVNDPGHPLLSRVTQSTYPPGSTLKLLIAGAALEQGVVTPNSTFEPCYGGFQFGNRFFRCWEPQGHGRLDLRGAIKHSCDTYFYQMGLKLGLDQMAEYARRCGFGHRLNVDLPEESNGLVPSRDYFNRRYGIRGWTKSLVLNLSIGQGEFLATPLQLASFFAALGNDGIMFTPHLVKQVQSKQGRVLLYKESMERKLPFSESTLQILKNAAVAAVNDSNSTGTQARVPGVIVAGKTGSAENPHGKEHSWFVCYAPAVNPQIAIAIIVENAGHGSEVAAPIAGKLIWAYLKKEKQLASADHNQN